ncbi:hypothetical protein AB0L97_20500 [Nocardia sp. NPDC051911]|uniref:hypothetical protein n=1 Tax=Nocardia sp. NPDC051911 TaxID=3154648 RepID=UPI00343663A8
MPKREIATSLLGRGPIPSPWVVMVLALVSEQWRIGATRAADKLSNMEALVLSKGMAGAGEIRNRGAEQLGKLVDQYKRTEAEIANARAKLGRLYEQRVIGVDGDVITAKEATERMQAVAASVQQDRDAGSVKHRRVPVGLRRISTGATQLDFVALLYFVTQVFNVDLAGISAGDGAAFAESIVPLLTSIVFAILGTAAVAIGLHFLGRDLKGYKDEHGHIRLPEGKARIIPLAYIGLAVTVAIGAGIVMAYRIVSDSLAAGNGITSAMILGAFFAVIVITVNVVVFSVHFRDGSLQTDEIDRLASQLEPIEAQRVALQHRIDHLIPELTVLRVKGDQAHATTLARMGEAIKGADQVRLLARSYHQGCGAETELSDQQNQPLRGLLLPDVTVDTSLLDDLLKQMAAEGATSDVSAEEATTAMRSRSDVTVPAQVDDEDELAGEW